MAITNLSPYGPLKGEVLLANGSRVLFEAPKWDFSYPISGSEGCCTIKAEERPNQSGIYMDGKQFTQKIREAQNQSIAINVHLTEEGKRAFKETVLGKVENKHSKPPVNSDDCVKDMYALLLEYVETFPREIELGDRAYPLLNRVYEDFINKETVKKQKTHSFVDAIEEARKVQGYYSPAVITNGDIVVRCHVAHQARYIIFKSKECIGMHRHTDDIVDMHDIDIFKGWYPAEPDDATWARAQSLSELIDKLKSPKKQEESTALFDVIGRAVLQHFGRVFTASHAGNFRISCNVMKNSWDVREHSSMVLENESRKTVEEFAQKRCINLKSGWSLVSITGLRG
jgi:hypothetical protein